jgi:methyltransferase (TIGR00027 family)
VTLRPGEASITAQRVAAHRLTFDRVPTDYGDSAADERLARDVSGPAELRHASRMTAYLAARTAFFDRLVTASIDNGPAQVVVAAAGYDGRALRYAKPGVRWFEVDHPDTQRDKRERLDRLGIDSTHIGFVAADFAVDDLAGGLAAAGHESARPTLFTCEGVAVYLDRAVLESLLHGLRSAAAPGSRLGITLSVASDAPGLAARRAEFGRAVASMGEPVRSVLTAQDAVQLFSDTGWRPREGSDRARHAGFVLAEPN